MLLQQQQLNPEMSGYQPRPFKHQQHASQGQQLAQRLRVSGLLQQANQLAHTVCSFTTARLIVHTMTSSRYMVR